MVRGSTPLRNSKNRSLLCGLGLLSILSSLAIADTDLVQPGQITLNPSSGPVVLTLQGPAYDSAAASNYGFDITYTDAATAGAVFRLVRPVGQYQWQFSTQQTDGSLVGRVAMQLGNDHSLTLIDPSNSANTILLHPGPTTDGSSGIFWNGNALALASQVVPLVNNGLTVGTNGRVGIGTSNPDQQLTITGNFEIPATTASAGAIYQNGSPLIHTYGNQNDFFGQGTGNFTMTGGANVGIGTNALQANTSGNRNIALGYLALAANQDGFNNVAIGAAALTSNLHGGSNIAIGPNALMSNLGDPTANPGRGFRNIAIGENALQSNTTGSFNAALGSGALWSNTTADSNTAVGDGALAANTTGSCNAAVGTDALWQNVTGGGNAALGFYSLSANVYGVNNVAVGVNSLSNNTGTAEDSYAGGYNTAVGAYAVTANTVGQDNVGVGFFALQQNTTGNSNAALGAGAGSNNTIGQNNTAIGSGAGRYSATGNNNTFIGMFSGLPDPADGQVATQRSNATAIGYNARVDADNAMVLGGTGGNAVNVGINTTTPAARLDVNGGAVVRGVLHVAAGGDIDMGVFTAGTNPLPPQ